MKVIEFQLQILQPWTWHPFTIIQHMDIRAPRPQPLSIDKTNGIGSVFLMILDSEKEVDMKTFLEEYPDAAKLCTPFQPFELDDTLYNSEYYVQWRLNDHPTILTDLNNLIH